MSAIPSYRDLLPQNPSLAKRCNEEYLQLFKNGQYERALLCLEEAIRWDPEMAALYYNKAVALDRLGYKEEALDCFNLGIEKSKDDSEQGQFFLQKGSLLFSLDRKEEALNCYDSAIYHNDQAIQQLSLEEYYKEDSPKLELNRRSARCFYEKGCLLMNLEEPEKALQCFDQAIRRDPNQASYHNRKGCSLHKLERYEEELLCYERAIALDSENSVFYGNKGTTLYKLGRYREALDCYQAAIDRAKQDSDKADYWFEKGDAYWELGEHEKALECSKRASQYAPDNPKYRNDQAIIFKESGHHQEALVHLERAIDRDPQNPKYYRAKASIYFHLEQYKNALYCYEELFRNSEPQAEDFAAKALIYAELKRFKEALRFSDKAIRLEPDNPKYYKKKRKVLQNLLKDCPESEKERLTQEKQVCETQALRCYDAAIQKDPKNEENHFVKGCFLQDVGQYKEALSCFDEAIRLDGKAEYYNRKGNVYHAQGQYREAIEYYTKALQLEEGNAVFHHNKAGALYKLYGSGKALPHYQRAVELDPKNAIYWADLGQIFQDLEKYDQALECYDKATALTSDKGKKAFYLNKKGILLGKMNRHEEELECYTEAIALNPHAPYFFNKALTYHFFGRYEEAFLCYEQAIERDSRNPLYHRKKGETLFALGRYQEAQEALLQGDSPSREMIQANEQLAVAKQELDAGWRTKAYDSFLAVLEQQPKRFEALEGAFRANRENPEKVASLFVKAGKLPFVEASYEQMVIELITRLPHKNLDLIQTAKENLPNEPLTKAYLQSLEQIQDLKERLDAFEKAPDWMKEDLFFLEAKERLPAQIEREARNAFDLAIFYATKAAPYYRPDLALQQTKSAIGFYRRIPQEKERLAFLSKILTDLEKDLPAFDREIDAIVEKILSLAQKPQIPKEATVILRTVVRDHMQPIRENPLYIGSLVRIVGEQVKIRSSFRKKSAEVDPIAFESALRSIFQRWQETGRGPDAPPQEQEQIEGASSSTE